MDQPELMETARLRRLYSGRVAARAGGAGCVTPEAILAVIRREGGEDERLARLEHVMSCAACHREYEWLKAVDEAALEAEGAAVGRARPWWSRAAPLALAASLVLAAGTALLVTRRGADVERGEEGEIELVAPRAGEAADRPLTFTWRPVSGASDYVLEVQRGDGSVAFSDTTSDTTLMVAGLTGGEYRWWVRETTDGAGSRSSGLRSLRLVDQ
jgi:hypothetical protein